MRTIEIERGALLARGKNGRFAVRGVEVETLAGASLAGAAAVVRLVSQRPGKQAPIVILGPSWRVARLLRSVARAIEREAAGNSVHIGAVNDGGLAGRPSGVSDGDYLVCEAGPSVCEAGPRMPWLEPEK